MILEHAFAVAAKYGLEGLSIGALAGDLKLSKAGLHGHFGTKEELQSQIIDFAVEQFSGSVLKDIFAVPRGEPCVRALFDSWLAWSQSSTSGGCFFFAAAAEFDDRPGPVRDRVVRAQKGALGVIATLVRDGVREGHFQTDTDPEQIAYEVHANLLEFHHSMRLLGDPISEARARTAFERLLGTIRVGSLTS